MNETTENAIVVLDNLSVVVTDETDLQEFFVEGSHLQDLYGRIAALAHGMVADPSTKEGIAQIKTAARQLASIKKKVDDVGKEVVSSLKELPKKIDANRAEFRKQMEALQDEIRRPVTEIEEREDHIADIKQMHNEFIGLNSDELKVKLELVKAGLESCKPEIWKESYDAVIAAYNGEIKAVETMIRGREAEEEKDRELAELKKKQEEADRIIRENKIKEEAERRAREEAALREEKLLREKEEAERRAKEAEMKAAAIAPAQVQQPAEKPMVAAKPGTKWTPEQKAVNNEVMRAVKAIVAEHLQGFTDTGYELVAKKIVGAILKGEIKNLKVVY